MREKTKQNHLARRQGGGGEVVLMSEIILTVSCANHPRLQNPCLFLSDAFFSVSLVLVQSRQC